MLINELKLKLYIHFKILICLYVNIFSFIIIVKLSEHQTIHNTVIILSQDAKRPIGFRRVPCAYPTKTSMDLRKIRHPQHTVHPNSLLLDTLDHKLVVISCLKLNEIVYGEIVNTNCLSTGFKYLSSFQTFLFKNSSSKSM